MVFNATFNNISVISCRPVSLVEETELPRPNHRPAASHWQILSHNVVCIEYNSPWAGFELTKLVVIGIGSCESNYHTCLYLNFFHLPVLAQKPNRKFSIYSKKKNHNFYLSWASSKWVSVKTAIRPRQTLSVFKTIH